MVGLPTATRPGASVLIIGHPGHELLVYQWMLDERPTVIILTDGSGGAGASRLGASRQTICSAGATLTSVVAADSDKRFYGAILSRDVAFFSDITQGVLHQLTSSSAELVVSDAAEATNPVHDICSAIATIAARAASAQMGRAVERYEIPIETYTYRTSGRGSAPCLSELHARLGIGPSSDRQLLADLELIEKARARVEAKGKAGLIFRHLAAAEVKRKVEILNRNVQLHEEAERYLTGNREGLSVECMTRVQETAPPLAEPEYAAVYEIFGRWQVAQGRYEAIVTYKHHVAPIVAALEREFVPTL